MKYKQAKRLKTSKLFTAVTLLNCLLCVFASPTNFKESLKAREPISFENFEYNPGIYFEHTYNLHLVNNIWDTVVYYDLRTYYQQLEGFEHCITKLTDLCNKTITYRYYCNSILAELQHKMENMQHNNLILHKRNGNHFITKKQKRAPLEFVGSLQNTLFGVLDQKYADYIEGEIEKVRENENYLLTLARNQTSITEVTTNVLKKTTQQIEHQFQVFNNHIITNVQALKSEINNNEHSQAFNSLATYMAIIMSNYETAQKDLIEVVLDAHNGKISPFLLTPVQLKGQINHIREQISASLIIPGEGSSEDLLALYKLITVKTRVTHSKIIFKIQIPLPGNKVFQLFKTYPVPTEHGGKYFYIKPSSEFIASSLHRDYFYPLTQSELTECS